MLNAYERWITGWENRLCFRSNNRVVRPFDWGLDWMSAWPHTQRYPKNGHDPETYLRHLNAKIIQESGDFFSYRSPRDFKLDANLLRFTSPVNTPYPENNIVHGGWWPARRPSSRTELSGARGGYHGRDGYDPPSLDAAAATRPD